MPGEIHSSSVWSLGPPDRRVMGVSVPEPMEHDRTGVTGVWVRSVLADPGNPAYEDGGVIGCGKAWAGVIVWGCIISAEGIH